MDSARTAVRLGAKEVFVLYRRTKEEVPATGEELREAEEEGVRVMYQVAPQSISGSDHVEQLTALHYVLGDKDPSGRRRPVEVPGTVFALRVDFVIAAISQQLGTDAGQDLELTRWGSILVDDKTGATNVAGVYAGGDCAKGPANVITAIADGKRAAASIDMAMAGKKALLVYDPPKTMSDRESALLRHGSEPRAWRTAQAVTPAARRRRSFDEYRPTLTAEQAKHEASRCLACGCGAGCEICKDICKKFAWCTDPQGRVVLDHDECVACGMCIHRCPNKNIRMIQTSDTPI